MSCTNPESETLVGILYVQYKYEGVQPGIASAFQPSSLDFVFFSLQRKPHIIMHTYRFPFCVSPRGLCKHDYAIVSQTLRRLQACL